MKAIRTLIDQQDASPGPSLPDDLRVLYGGDLRFQASSARRPYVVGFVSTLDGVISFEVPGHSGGGTISGSDEADSFVMGLLRASVDAVVVAAGTVSQVSPNHLWIAESIYPKAKDSYAGYRQRSLKKMGHPLLVVVSGRGRLDLGRAIFHAPGARVLIVTTKAGSQELASAGVSALDSTKVVALDDSGGLTDPSAILTLLHDEYGLRIVVDEVFLTLAPQIAGRTSERPRPGMVAGVAFLPEGAPWFKLVSAKYRGDHLYLRYRMKSGT